MAEAGHNSPLRGFIDRIERLEEERRALGDDVKDVYAEAKAAGLNPKAMRRIVTLRRMDRDKLKELAGDVDVYASELGMDAFA